MSEDKLPTLRERWNQLKETYDAVSGACYNFWVGDYDRYVDFTAQTLTLSMFLPCTEDGEPLEKPMGTTEEIIKVIPMNQRTGWEEYQKALKSVLFEGWYQKVPMPFHVLPEKSGNVLDIRHKTVEQLMTSGIELIPTDTCKKLYL